MELIMKEGLQHTSTLTVTANDTAAHYGSGRLEVLATPAMAALMENAAMLAVAGFLPEENDTVGTELNIEHVRASAIGTKVEATATLVRIDGRRLSFLVEAFDEKGLIGKGSHTRFIIDKEKFIRKLNQ